MVLFMFLPVKDIKKGKFVVPGLTVPKGFVKGISKFNFTNMNQKNKKRKVYIGWR